MKRSAFFAAAAALLTGMLSCVPLFAAESPPAEIVDRTALRACLSPNNMPLSNEKGEGFENKIAEIVGEELGLPVESFYFPQGVGYVRNTLNERNCDLIVGISLTNELLQNTNPYYTSTYVMLFRRDLETKPESMNDPALAGLKKGIIVNTPPVNVLIENKMFTNFKSFHVFSDTRNYSNIRRMVEELREKKLDVIFLWGPFGGYYGKLHEDELETVVLRPEDYDSRMAFRITMGMRRNEVEWKKRINRILRKRKADIDALLLSYGVPLLER